MCSYMQEHAEFVKLIFSNSDTDSDFAALLPRSYQVNSLYRQILPKNIGEYKAELMTIFFANGAYNMMRRWILDDFPIPSEEMGEMIYNLFVCSREIS